jgi:DNA-directed RNA polymerase specialized sigma24 family protein
VWLRIDRVSHTYGPSEPLLSWVYAIARRVDNYRKRQRIALRESATEVLPEPPSQKNELKRDLPRLIATGRRRKPATSSQPAINSTKGIPRPNDHSR